MKKVTASAPGKLMLLGDHAVVWGHPCLVTAVDYRVFAEVADADKDAYNLPDGCSSEFVETALAVVRGRYNSNQRVSITTWADYQESYGLGSSSAVTVALVKGLLALIGQTVSQKELFDICYQIVLDVQGVGSGFDIAAAIWGKTLYFFTGGAEIRPVNTNLSLIVAYSGEKGHTPTLIKQVHDLYKQKKEFVDANFAQSEELVKEAKRHLKNNNLKAFGDCMNKNHELLQELGVSTPMLDKLVSTAQIAGAYGAKLSGAGGGDCMIAVVSATKEDSVRKALEASGGTIIDTKTNAEGVRIDK